MIRKKINQVVIFALEGHTVFLGRTPVNIRAINYYRFCGRNTLDALWDTKWEVGQVCLLVGDGMSY